MSKDSGASTSWSSSTSSNRSRGPAAFAPRAALHRRGPSDDPEPIATFCDHAQGNRRTGMNMRARRSPRPPNARPGRSTRSSSSKPSPCIPPPGPRPQPNDGGEPLPGRAHLSPRPSLPPRRCWRAAASPPAGGGRRRCRAVDGSSNLRLRTSRRQRPPDGETRGWELRARGGGADRANVRSREKYLSSFA
jgi:hypothetical protein